MMDQTGLGLFIAGAVGYQAVAMAGLVGWLWKRGVRVPRSVSIGPETRTERKKMVAVVALFWVAALAIIFGTW